MRWLRAIAVVVFVLSAAAYPRPVAGAWFASDAGTARAAVPRPAAAGKSSVHADWRISQIIDRARHQGVAAGVAAARDAGIRVSGDRIRVIVETSDATAASRAIAARGATVERQAGDLVQVLATPAELEAMLSLPSVDWIRPPLPRNADAVTDEAVATTGASNWQSSGQSGAGVKVAIVDLGFSGYATAQSLGELPASLTAIDYCGGGLTTYTAHGTAVSEIVHKMAPSSQLYLICVDTEVDLAEAESYAKANGISIVNHSVSWFQSSRGDGSGGPGSPDATVADAKSNGILWVNAAGNYAQYHWSGHFVDDGAGNNVFSGSDAFDRFSLATGSQVCVYLKWDSWPYATQDFDLQLWRMSNETLVAESTNNQMAGNVAPTEDLCYTNSGATQQYGITIYLYAGTGTPRFDLFALSGSLQYVTPGGSVTEPASSPSALAAGAVAWSATTIEAYSSLGPTIDGRMKPDLSGQDRVSTYTYGSQGFSGTSAASPHVAGAAALVEGVYPTYTPGQIQSYLEAQATDLGTAGPDNTYGYGLLRLPPAARPGAPTAVSAAAYNRSALVTWVAPASSGGTPVTAYTVTSLPGGLQCVTARLGCTVDGLANGTPYTFTVTAANAFGDGPASSASNQVTPKAVPDAPAAIEASGGNGSATVSWDAAADNGNAVTGYVATASPGGASCPPTTAFTCTVGGLTNGVEYTFTVTAENALGSGPASAASNPVTPATVPGKPTAVKAVGSDGRAVVSWSAPASDGGAAIEGYEVTPSGGTPCSTSGALSCTLTGLTNRSSYTFTVVAHNRVGDGAPSDASAPVTPLAGATYVTVTPNRLVDSRSGTRLGLSASLRAGVPVSFQVTGRLPSDATRNVPSDAIAVTGNLTVTRQTAGGYLALTPAAPSGTPATSTLNFPIADNRANAVTVPLGAGGTLWLTYSAASGNTTDAIFDVTGYFLPNASGATFVAVTPDRIVDSRLGTRLGLSSSLSAGVPASFRVTGGVPGDAGYVPGNAVAVTGNLTVTRQTAGGFFALTPVAPSGVSTTSTLNFPVADNRANAVTVPLGADGKLWLTYSAPAGNTADAIFDVSGYFVPDATGATYVAVSPNRLVDSRSGTRLGLSASLSANTPATFQVSGRVAGDPTKNVPGAAVAVTGNLTVTRQTKAGYFALTPLVPAGTPAISTLNFPSGENRANAVTVPLSPSGTLTVTYVAAAGNTADVVFDVSGYFSM